MDSAPIYLSLQWLTAEEGGRAQPPPGPEYKGIAQAEGVDEGWSVRLVFIGATSRAEATFLVPEAAEQLGATFWLVEGRRRVAQAQVVTPSLRPL